MTKKSFVIILILSVVVTYIADLTDAVINNTLLAGEVGFPFKDQRGTLFGEGTTNNFMFLLNMLFWFMIILIIWKLFLRFRRK